MIADLLSQIWVKPYFIHHYPYLVCHCWYLLPVKKIMMIPVTLPMIAISNTPVKVNLHVIHRLITIVMIILIA